MKKPLLIIFLYCTAVLFATAQQNVNIQIKLSGWKENKCLLVNYFGTKQYVQDTLTITKETLTVKRETPLLPGMYAIVDFKGNLIMDFFVDKHEQQFSMSSSLKNIPGDMQIKKSENNTLFYQWIHFVTQNKNIADSLGKIIHSLYEQEKEQEAEPFIKKLEDLNHQAELKKKNFENRPELLVSRFMKAQQDVFIPVQHENGEEMSQWERYYYAQNHFFDNMRLDDEALLRTPVYGRKLEWYFENLMPPIPDTVIKYSDMLIEKSKGNFKTFQYVVWQANYHAETSKTMGMDKVFVHIIDTYYAPHDSLAIPDLRARLMKRADELRYSLIGVKAPNMIIQDSSFILRELYKINADFVIIYFFDPDCSHCKAETDTLLMFYQQEKDILNFEVYAVCGDTSMQKMKNYIQLKKVPWTVVNGPRTMTQHYSILYDVPSMPTAYLIDKDKMIIAKRVYPKQMIELIRRKRMEMK